MQVRGLGAVFPDSVPAFREECAKAISLQASGRGSRHHDGWPSGQALKAGNAPLLNGYLRMLRVSDEIHPALNCRMQTGKRVVWGCVKRWPRLADFCFSRCGDDFDDDDPARPQTTIPKTIEDAENLVAAKRSVNRSKYGEESCIDRVGNGDGNTAGVGAAPDNVLTHRASTALSGFSASPELRLIHRTERILARHLLR